MTGTPENQRKKANDRQITLLNSPLARLGVTPKGKIDGSLLNPFCFDLYAYGPRPGLQKGARATYSAMLNSVLLDTFGQEVGILTKVKDEVSPKGNTNLIVFQSSCKKDPLAAHKEKTAAKFQARMNFLRATDAILSNEYDYFFKRWSVLQMANPLKWVEFFIRFIHLTVHYGLSRMGAWLQNQFDNKDHSVVIRGLALVALCLVVVTRLVLQVALGITAYVVRAVVSPIKSFHENNGVHPAAGLLSATISAVGIGALLYFTAPLWLPALTAGLAILGVNVAIALSVAAIAAPVMAAFTFLNVCTSGAARDAFIWAKYIAAQKPENGYTVLGVALPEDTHPAFRAARHNKPDKTKEEMQKSRGDVPAMVISGIALGLPIAVVLGFITGLAQRLKSAACSQIAGGKLGLFGNKSRVPSTTDSSSEDLTPHNEVSAT